MSMVVQDSQKDSDKRWCYDDIDTCAKHAELGETVDANRCSDSQEDADNDGVFRRYGDTVLINSNRRNGRS